MGRSVGLFSREPQAEQVVCRQPPALPNKKTSPRGGNTGRGRAGRESPSSGRAGLPVETYAEVNPLRPEIGFLEGHRGPQGRRRARDPEVRDLVNVDHGIDLVAGAHYPAPIQE